MISRHVFISSLNIYTFLVNQLIFSLCSSNEVILNETQTLNSTNFTNSNETNPFIYFGTLHTLANLSNWAQHEESLSIVLTERLKLLQKESKLIESYLKDYKETTRKALENVYEPKTSPEERGEVIGSSSVLGHRMITRYTSIISQLKELLKSSKYVQNVELVQSELNYDGDESDISSPNLEPEPNKSHDSTHIEWPNWKDKFMSITALLHIQEVHGLSPSEIQVGLTLDTTHGGNLTAHDCVEIGMFALYRNYYYFSIEWFEHAKLLIINGDNSTQLDNVQAMLNLAIQENNRVWKYIDSAENTSMDNYMYNVYSNPVLETDEVHKRETGRALAYSNGRNESDANANKDLPNFYDLCIGHTLMSLKDKTKLKCYYENKRHPYLYINPAKVELLAKDPPIYQFYDVLGNKEIERIIEIGSPHFTLSSVVGESDFEAITEYRTSVGTGLFHEDLESALKYAEIFSGIKIFNSSELTQIVEYTYGRFYSYHSDAFVDEEEVKETVLQHGDRLATILYYLELPKLGGLTPFCYAGVSANPVRGSAILWFNMFRNGTVDEARTIHGACPVLHGNKIIINHWIRYGGNFQSYKCSLNQFE